MLSRADHEKGGVSDIERLMLLTLGSEKRLLYFGNLAVAGPLEVNAAARHALAEGDRELAAAICMRLDSMKPDAKKSLVFRKPEFATAVLAMKKTEDFDK